MPRLFNVLAATLCLLGCSRKDEVVVAAPIRGGAAQPAGAAAGQPPPAEGDELPPGHPPLDGAGGAPAVPRDGLEGADGAAPPHGAAMSAGGDAGDVKVPRATGPDARTVAEVFAQRSALKDRTVTVRGKVVKYTPGVMGRNWLHLRDGTGTRGKDDDVTVTTQDAAARGEVVTVRGTVALDQDIGMGEPYPVIIRDAKVLR